MFSVLFLLSCNNVSYVYTKFQKDFSENRWFNDDTRLFEVAIGDDTQLYDLELQFGHIYDYNLSNVPLEVIIKAPSGTIEKLKVDVLIKGKDGKDLGDCTGDICDVYHVLKSKTSLEKGLYIIEIKQASKLVYLPNVLGIGLNVRKSN
jgi:gliding motility-associated lipoprotein GldH